MQQNGQGQKRPAQSSKSSPGKSIKRSPRGGLKKPSQGPSEPPLGPRYSKEAPCPFCGFLVTADGIDVFLCFGDLMTPRYTVRFGRGDKYLLEHLTPTTPLPGQAKWVQQIKAAVLVGKIKAVERYFVTKTDRFRTYTHDFY